MDSNSSNDIICFSCDLFWNNFCNDTVFMISLAIELSALQLNHVKRLSTWIFMCRWKNPKCKHISWTDAPAIPSCMRRLCGLGDWRSDCARALHPQGCRTLPEGPDRGTRRREGQHPHHLWTGGPRPTKSVNFKNSIGGHDIRHIHCSILNLNRSRVKQLLSSWA